MNFINRQLFSAILFFTTLVAGLSVFAQPSGYYNNAEGLYGTSLKQALHNIIDDHTVRSYNQLWDDFYSTDRKSNGKVWDMYSDRPNGSPAYQYTFGNDQCGNYSGEGDCYNREHSWPKSWFNDHSPMNSDLFHIVPTDGYVNNRRSNYALGEVGSASWTSTNGSKLGNCSTPGFSGTCFEPIDEYKGDFARMMFYMSVRYYTEDGNWSTSNMTNKSTILPWAMTMLLRWHQDDPVSQKEIDRNNAIYNFQHNRNPFIDRPEFAVNIWDPSSEIEDQYILSMSVYPNPVSASGDLNISWNSTADVDWITISDLSGRVVYQIAAGENNTAVLSDIDNLKAGFYLIHLIDNQHVQSTSKLIIQ